MRSAAIALVMFLTACDSPAEPDDKWAIPEEIDYAESLGIDLALMNRTEIGLYWQDIIVGEGEPPVVLDNVEVRFHYTIWLPDGRAVIETRGGAPHQSSVLLLIPGVAEGMAAGTGMRPGGPLSCAPKCGVRKLVIPPQLAWMNGKDDIPPLTTIIYEIELLWVEPR